jgi:hypothetical protein
MIKIQVSDFISPSSRFITPLGQFIAIYFSLGGLTGI